MATDWIKDIHPFQIIWECAGCGSRESVLLYPDTMVRDIEEEVRNHHKELSPDCMYDPTKISGEIPFECWHIAAEVNNGK